MAAFQMKSVALDTWPCWTIGDARLGANSYHLTSDRPPEPAIVCWVQNASAPMLGSKCATACVSRPSRLSTWYLVPGCGTLAGIANVGTEMSPSATSTGLGEDVMCHTITFDCGASAASWAPMM